jgi:dynein light chain 1
MEGAALNALVKCKRLSLSSNNIDKMVNLPGLRNLEILSLSRNLIKKITGLEEIGIESFLNFRINIKRIMAII